MLNLSPSILATTFIGLASGSIYIAEAGDSFSTLLRAHRTSKNIMKPSSGAVDSNVSPN